MAGVPAIESALSKRLMRAVIGALCVLVPAAALADIEMSVANNSAVFGELVHPDGGQSLRFNCPAGAKLIAKIKGLPGVTTPTVTFRVLDAQGTELGKVTPRGRGAKLTPFVLPASGSYRLQLVGDGANVGLYAALVKWKSRRVFKETVQLAGAPVEVRFAADAGALVNFKVKAAKGSGALPRLGQLDADEGSFSHVFAQPLSASANVHVAKSIRVTDTGNYTLRIDDAGAAGGAAVVVKVLPPKASKRNVIFRADDLPAPPPGLSDLIVGGLLGPGGGKLEVPEGVFDEISGAGLELPEGSNIVSSIFFHADLPLKPSDADLVPIGPAVNFEPSGTQFAPDGVVSIPFDPTGLGGDFSSVRVFQEDDNGLVLVPPASYLFDIGPPSRVSFPVAHFTTFQAFAPSSLVNRAVVPPHWLSPRTLAAFTESKLAASDQGAGDQFGSAVAISGDTAIVGARYWGAVNPGAAYVYTRSGATWTEQQQLVASDAAIGHWFGSAVAIDGDVAVVGAQNTVASSRGAVYVFRRSAGVWTEETRLTGSGGFDGDGFGTAVAIDGGTLVVGARAGPGDPGSAYVFVDGGGGSWSLEQKLASSTAADHDRFGVSVAVQGDTLLVGADGEKLNGVLRGACHVFARSGGAWSETDTLVDPVPFRSRRFGTSVALDRGTAVVGDASGTGVGLGTGSVHAFTLRDSVWNHEGRLTAGDGEQNDRFGGAVDVSGNLIVVGADRNAGKTGAAYVFQRAAAAWTEQRKIMASDGAAGDWFGRAVGIDDDLVIVGAHLHDDTFDRDGASYVVDLLP